MGKLIDDKRISFDPNKFKKGKVRKRLGSVDVYCLRCGNWVAHREHDCSADYWI